MEKEVEHERKEKYKNEKEKYRTAPTITSINISLAGEQELYNLNMSFTGGNMQRRAAIQINAIDINALI